MLVLSKKKKLSFGAASGVSVLAPKALYSYIALAQEKNESGSLKNKLQNEKTRGARVLGSADKSRHSRSYSAGAEARRSPSKRP